MKEREYYPAIERFARSRLGCFTTAIDTGLRIGRVDVVGLKDTGGRLDGSGEVIAIEVKRGRSPFLTSIGQAAGYSVLADRCYLADIRAGSFTDEEIEIAQELGVGLIAISGTQRVRVSLELRAPRSTSVTALRAELIERLHYSTCTICNSFFERGEPGNFRARVEWKDIDKTAKTGKGFMYWLEEQDERSSDSSTYVYTRRYVCPECVTALWPSSEG